MRKTVREQLRTYTSVLGLGVVLVFAGCVKQHSDRVSGTDATYAISDIGVTATDDHGVQVGRIDATYLVQDNYVGCVQSDLDVGSLAANDKVVVSLSTGSKAACTKPSALATMSEKPSVTFFKAPGPTEYYIQTREVIRTSGRTGSPTGVKVEDGVGIRLLDIVDYTTNSPLLAQVRDKIELRALPGKRYKVYHKITPKVLYLMKVATKDELSHLDLPIADNLGNGEYAVPIAAVSISLSQYRNVRNSDGKGTNVYEFRSVENLSEATHINFNVNDFEEVKMPSSVTKDVYPANYFISGQWYVNESVVDTRPGSEGFIGTTTGAFDSDFRGASRVQFTRTGTSLVACNVGIDERYADDKECEESASVLTIPASGHAFKLDTTDSSVKEIKILSSQAPFVKVDLISISSIRKSIDELFSVVRDTNKDQLLEINFAKNKFSFVVQRGANGRRIMYSFLKIDGRDKYETRRHYKDDRQDKFGYFVQTVSKIRSSDTIAREEDLEKDYLVQRHNPAKDIIFHFSNLSPDYKKGTDPYGLEIDYRQIGRNAIEYWNKAYKRAGAPNRVLMNEDFDAPFGDIAYNTMNLIDSERGSNLLGVGPSLVDPYSGEVINANANVYIAPFREIVAGQVRNYIKARTGLLDEPAKQLPDGATDNSTLIGEMAASSLGIKDVLSTIVPENIMKMVANFYHHGVVDFTTKDIQADGFAGNSDAVTDLYSLTKFNSETSLIQNLAKIAVRVPELVFLRDQGQITFKPRSRKELLKLKQALETHRPTFYRSFFMSDMGLASDYNTMTGQIEEQCGEVLQLVSFIKNRAEAEKKPAHMTTAEELPALRHCMTQIIPGKFQATLIHELGHTLGLRHNFYASADKENFFKKEEVKEIYGLDVEAKDLPRSSSVMDYVRTEQDRLTYPGHYDIAAIRYGYANAVEVKSAATRPNTLGGKYVDLKKGGEHSVAGSILDELAEQGAVIKPFAYCTDIAASLEIDPLCARHDFGTSPKMIVEDSINSFWESMTLYNFRYDRGRAAVTGPFRRASRLDKLKRIYTEWRVHLANHLGKTDSTGNVYLQRYQKDEYVALLDGLRADPNFKGKAYLEARDEIFDFILDVAFFPNKYCLLGNESGLKAYEFDKLRAELKNQVPRGTKVSSCEDPYMQDLIKSKGFEYYLEAGLPVDNLWYAVNPQDTFEEDVEFRSFRAPLDVVGSFLDRYFASTFLGGRQAGYTGLLEKMFPNMMDEPDLYEKFEARMVDRLTKGVDLRDVFERANDVSLPEEVNMVLPNYDSESALLKALWLSLEQGIRNQYVDTRNKLSKYTRSFTDNLDQIKDARENGAFVMPLTDGSSLIVRPEATVAFSLAQALIEVSQTLQGGNQQIPTVDQLKGSLDPLVVQLADSLVVPAEQEGMTAEQYLAFARNLLGTFAQLDPLQQQMLQEIYLDDLLMYLVVINPLEQQGEAAVNAVIAEWNAKGLAAVAAEVQAQIDPNRQQYNVSVPSAESVSALYNEKAQALSEQIVKEAVTAQEQIKAVLVSHGDEFEAQYDLLRSILIFDFAEVQADFGIRFAEIFGDKGADMYKNLMNNSRTDIRIFAETYLSPKLIAQTKWGVEFPFDKFMTKKK